LGLGRETRFLSLTSLSPSRSGTTDRANGS
jgi:hypothetical protein